MKKIKLESYNGRSMESGPTGWDGIIREEPPRVRDDEDDFDELREQLSGVPEVTDDDIHILTSREDVDRVHNSTSKRNSFEFDEGEDEYDKYLAELEER